MTAAVISSLPFQAGGAIAAAAGRVMLWGFSQYMRQPLRNTGVAAMVGLSSLAGSNALYFQTHRHPAPLFGVVDQRVAAADTVTPVTPAPRPKTLKLPAADTTTTGSVDADAALPPIGNAEVFEVQRKLQALKLFDATVDGLYGPRTARAIKAFEERQGMKPKGELTREIVDLIISTSIIAEAPKVEPLPTPDPLPAAKAQPAAVTIEVAPLPAPAPLVTATITVPSAEAAAVAPLALARDYPESPQEALDIVAETAGDAIDTILDGVQTLSMTKPSAVTKRVVQTIPIKANVQTATAQPVQQAMPPAVIKPEPAASLNDADTVSKVQRGLASLGFLHGTIDGVAGEATAKAIRNFEVYYNYDVTGRISPGLVNLLVQNGAVI